MLSPIKTLLLFIAAACSLEANAQGLSSGARSTALAHADVALPDPWSTYANQALLCTTPRMNVGLFVEQQYLLHELTFASINLVLPTSSGTFALSGSQFGAGQFKERWAGIAYALPIAEFWNLGLQIDFLQLRIPENEQGKHFATFELGLFHHPPGKLSYGLHLYNPANLQPSFLPAYFETQRRTEMGCVYSINPQLLISFETQKIGKRPLGLASGIEFSPLNSLAFRIGIQQHPTIPSLGLGINRQSYSLDFAFSMHPYLGLTPSFSIQFHRP